MKSKIRVLIVDDHAMIRLALAEAIARKPQFELAGEAIDGEQAVEMCRRVLPDVVTMDFQLPGIDGVEASTRILEGCPSARIILISVFDGEEDIWRAVQAGARGYLLKSLEVEELLDAIQHVAAGDTYFPPKIAAKIAARRSRQNLTPREIQVLQQLVAGRSNKEIAADLGVSESMAKAHLKHLFAKLGVADRTQAAITAVHRGLVHLKI